MNAATRNLVRQRAGNRCEYCRVHQDDLPFFRFQIEHAIARQQGGLDDEDNWALECPECNLHKGPNLSGLAPLDGALVALFHPRRDRWEDHFTMDGALIVGTTPTGRVTVRVLNMNDPLRVEQRRAILQRQAPGS